MFLLSFTNFYKSFSYVLFGCTVMILFGRCVCVEGSFLDGMCEYNRFKRPI